MNRARTVGMLLCLVLLLAGLPAAEAQRGVRQIHEEKSLYRNIIVTEDSQRRCLRFTITRRQGQNQSCRFNHDHRELVFPYAKMTLSSLLLQPEPERILIVGLGGGTLPDTYSELFPGAEILVSEIDEAVLRVARRFFDFEETPRVKVEVGDGRVHIKRLGLRGERFDLIILDAFNGEYIPEHLMTREFLEEVKGLLNPDGMVVSNTFSGSKLYDAESATYQAVFGEFLNLRMSGTGNRIIIATPGRELPSSEDLRRRAEAWQERLAPYGMEVTDYPPYMRREPDWDEEARLLTDQYAPVNLLNR